MGVGVLLKEGESCQLASTTGAVIMTVNIHLVKPRRAFGIPAVLYSIADLTPCI
jgi:hypothetical protein